MLIKKCDAFTTSPFHVCHLCQCSGTFPTWSYVWMRKTHRNTRNVCSASSRPSDVSGRRGASPGEAKGYDLQTEPASTWSMKANHRTPLATNLPMLFGWFEWLLFVNKVLFSSTAVNWEDIRRLLSVYASILFLFILIATGIRGIGFAIPPSEGLSLPTSLWRVCRGRKTDVFQCVAACTQ